jgi:glycosyltransferase involved in cell wall biosynthesis
VRIAWVSPLARRSAIAAVSVAVVEELDRFVEVELIHPSTRAPLPTAVRSLSLSDCPVRYLQDFDHVVYSMGDSRFHTEVYAASQAVPGVVVLHDVVLHHFFGDLWLGEGGVERYVAELQRFTDPGTANAARDRLDEMSRWDWTPESPELVPLLEPALLGALGVITHTAFAARRVEDRFDGPVATIPLPVFRHLDPPGQAGGREPVVVTSIGHVNRNRNVELAIRAIGSSSLLRERLRYVVVGACGHVERERLLGLVHELGLEEVVELRGTVGDAGLATVLDAAEIGINLRYPVAEAASMSQLEEMAAGLAVVVVDDGHYAELPDDAVVKLERPPGRTALTEVLERLVDDRELRHAIGRRASDFVRARHRPDHYARAVIDFLAGPVAYDRPVLTLVDDVSRALQRAGARGTDTMVRRGSAAIGDLFFSPPAGAGGPVTGS